MKRLLWLICLLASPAFGQFQGPAANTNVVVTTCGTVPADFPGATNRAPDTIDVNGNKCVAGISSSGVTGSVASGAADSGNPVKTGGVYNTTPPTVTNGQRVDDQSDNRGNKKITVCDNNGTNCQDVDANGFASVVQPSITVNIPPISAQANGAAVDIQVTENARLLVANMPGTMASGAITTAMTGTASVSLLPGTASNYTYLSACSFTNTHASVDTEIVLQDGSGGSTIWTVLVPHGAVSAPIIWPDHLKVSATAGHDLYAANLTNGSATKVSCSGFKSTLSY